MVPDNVSRDTPFKERASLTPEQNGTNKEQYDVIN